MSEPKCLNPNCQREAAMRGLCTSCYQTARKLVKDGQTTWEKLKLSGKCTAGKKSGKAGTTGWLLS